jgi:hypothetical protein
MGGMILKLKPNGGYLFHLKAKWGECPQGYMFLLNYFNNFLKNNFQNHQAYHSFPPFPPFWL